jgi:hypothetical protein
MANIIAYLQKTFVSLCSSITLPLGIIAYELVKCAKSNTYVETFTNHADTLHLWIKKSYEEDYKKAFESIVRKTIKRLGINYAHIAIDYTKEPFYGKSSGLHIINTKGEKWDAEFHFLVVSLITREKQIPLMALPIRVGEGISSPTIELLDYSLSLFRKIRLATFDREFYCAEIIDFLEAKRIKYLILMPEKGKVIKDYITKTEELRKFKHTMTYAKEKSKWKPKTMVAVCKGIDEFPWMFATNIHFRTRVEYIWHYKRRWQIETNFRVEDEGRIKSKSCSYLVRYFYFLISLLLHLLWIGHKNLKYYVPYKKYLDIIEHTLLFNYLEIGGT